MYYHLVLYQHLDRPKITLLPSNSKTSLYSFQSRYSFQNTFKSQTLRFHLIFSTMPDRQISTTVTHILIYNSVILNKLVLSLGLLKTTNLRRHSLYKVKGNKLYLQCTHCVKIWQLSIWVKKEVSPKLIHIHNLHF